MKKVLLSLAALACAAAPALADEATIVMEGQTYTKSDGSTTTFSGANRQKLDNDGPGYIEADGFKLTTTKGTTTGSAYLNGNKELRIYAGGSIEIAAPAGMQIEHIAFFLSMQGKKRQPEITVNYGTIDPQAATNDVVSWTGDASDVTFTVGDKAIYSSDGETGQSQAGQFCFTQITITYSAGTAPVEKKNAELEFSAAEVTFTLDQEPEVPVLTKATTAQVHYASSNPEVAIVNEDTGVVTLVATGTTTITATSAENEEYLAGEASYILNVEPAQSGAVEDTIVINDFTGWPNVMQGYGANLGDSYSFTVNGYTLDTKKVSQMASPCAFRYQYKDLRVYDGNSLTITAPEGKEMTKIVFNQTVLGVQSQPAITVSDGEMSQSNGAETITWTGKAHSVTFTVGGNDFGTAPDNMGLLSFPTATVTLDSQVGVEAIETENGPARYFNLQGVEVNNPEKGLYIRVANGKSTKVIIR